MSALSSLVRAAIETGAAGFIRDIRAEHLLEDESGLYGFVRNHLNRHGVLPSMDIVAQAGFDLVRTQGQPPSFFQEQIRTRYAFNQLNANQPRYAAAMQAYDPATAILVLREMLVAVGNTMAPHAYSTLVAEVQNVLADFEFAKANPGLRGVTMAWPTLNELTLGAQGGDLIVIVARPSMGKSYLLMECAHDAWTCNHSSIFISMEMTLLQIAYRWAGRCAGINPRLIKQGILSTWAEDRFRHTIGGINEGTAPVHFLAGDMEKRMDGIEEMANEFCPDIIYIDAAYLLEPTLRTKSAAAKWEQLSQVIKELKKLAQRLNRAIVITVQFNRNVSSSGTKELDMKDIGGTDSIPQDASVVLGVRKGPAPFQKTKRIIECMKNRDGETRSFATDFRFDPPMFGEVPLEEPAEEATTQNGGVSPEWMV